MWNFFATVRNRHSIRKYQVDMPVEPEKLHAILEMACAAPSAGDLQAYHICVVSDATQRNALCQAAQNQQFVREAPTSLVFCTDASRSEKKFGERGRTLYTVQDVTIAAAYAQLASVAAGLGSTWVGHFDEQEVITILDIAQQYIPIAILCLGYPAEFPELTSRRHFDEMISYQ